MTGPSRREIEAKLRELESDGDVGDHVHVAPEQARRIEWAFSQWDGVDAERLAHLYTYGPDETDGGEIAEIIGRASRTISLTYSDTGFTDLQHAARISRRHSPLWIAGGRDRRAQSISSESASVTYETSVMRQLHAQVSRLDPGSGIPFRVLFGIRTAM